MASLDLHDELALALRMADVADAVTLSRYEARDFSVDRKADRSEVTEVDRNTEATIRSTINAERPDHAVLGEEAGLDGPTDAEWRWVIDPIDATSNFVKGVPIWATLIALQHVPAHGVSEVVMGVCSAPALHRRWWAARGLGAFANGHRINVSDVSELAEAHLASPGSAIWHRHGNGPAYEELARSVWRERGLGDFWQHMLVAEGAFDIACEPIVSMWDLAAMQIIVEEAGGRFTDLSGAPRPDGGSAVSTNGLLHDIVLQRLTA